MTSHKEIVEDYSSSLNDLTSNARPIIDTLTTIAQENIIVADEISNAIENRIKRAIPEHKLFALYLLDSICKNIGNPYNVLFGNDLFKLFSESYVLVSDTVRQKLINLFKTWKIAKTSIGLPLFPQDQLDLIEAFLIRATKNIQKPYQQAQQLPQHASVQYSVHNKISNGSLIKDIDQLVPIFQKKLAIYPHDSKLKDRFDALHQLKLILSNQIMNENELKAVNSQLENMKKAELKSPLLNNVALNQFKVLSSHTPAIQQQIESPSLSQQLLNINSLQNILSSAQGKIQNPYINTGNTMINSDIYKMSNLATNNKFINDNFEKNIIISGANVSNDDSIINNFNNRNINSVGHIAANANTTNGIAITNTVNKNNDNKNNYINNNDNDNNKSANLNTSNKTDNNKGKANVLFKSLIESGLISGNSSISVNASSNLGKSVTIPSTSVLEKLLKKPIKSDAQTANSQQLSVSTTQINSGTKTEVQSGKLTEYEAEINKKLSTIDLSQQFLTSSTPEKLIELLYQSKENKCGTCGKRFSNDVQGINNRRLHLDWHFRINKKLKNEKIIQSRNWYLDDLDWSKFRDYTILENNLNNLIEFSQHNLQNNGVNGTNIEKSEFKYVVVPNDHLDMTVKCGICKDQISAIFSDELGEWIWPNSISVKNGVQSKIFHGNCYNETVNSNSNTISNLKREREGNSIKNENVEVEKNKKPKLDFSMLSDIVGNHKVTINGGSGIGNNNIGVKTEGI